MVKEGNPNNSGWRYLPEGAVGQLDNARGRRHWAGEGRGHKRMHKSSISNDSSRNTGKCEQIP